MDIFEIAAARGFKILYQLGTGAVQVNHGGPFNRSSLLDEMIANITLVKDQKALLGYYICDDCCSTQIDVSMQAQAYNIIKNIDPYHATVGAVNCEDTWTFSDVPSYLDSEIPKNSKTQPNLLRQPTRRHAQFFFFAFSSSCAFNVAEVHFGFGLNFMWSAPSR